MTIRVLISFVFLIASIACEKKEDSFSSASQSESMRSSESVNRRSADSESQPMVREVPKPRDVCVPTIQGMRPEDVPKELRVYCDTKEPLDPVAYKNYVQRVQNAVSEAQQEIAARQQAMQATGDPRLAGVQQQQDNCEYRYPGVFPQDGPMAGMCANSQAEIDAYLGRRSAEADIRHNNDMAQLSRDAASQCRKVCRLSADNVSLCLAGCPVN